METMRSSQKNTYGKLKPLDATERINFRANTDITKMISAIADTADHASVSDLIRTAVTIAYLCWCEYRGNLLLRNHDGHELQLSFPERDKPDGSWITLFKFALMLFSQATFIRLRRVVLRVLQRKLFGEA
jgi:hypothetical protein